MCRATVEKECECGKTTRTVQASPAWAPAGWQQRGWAGWMCLVPPFSCACLPPPLILTAVVCHATTVPPLCSATKPSAASGVAPTCAGEGTTGVDVAPALGTGAWYRGHAGAAAAQSWPPLATFPLYGAAPSVGPLSACPLRPPDPCLLCSCGRHPCRRRCCDGVSCPPCEDVCNRWLKCVCGGGVGGVVCVCVGGGGVGGGGGGGGGLCWGRCRAAVVLHM